MVLKLWWESKILWGTCLKCRLLGFTHRDFYSVGTRFFTSTPRVSESGDITIFEKTPLSDPIQNIFYFPKLRYLNILNQTTIRIKYKLRRIQTLRSLSTFPWHYPKWITGEKEFSSRLSWAHLTPTRNCGNEGDLWSPLILWPRKLKVETSCDLREVPQSVHSSTPILGSPTPGQKILLPKQMET